MRSRSWMVLVLGAVVLASLLARPGLRGGDDATPLFHEAPAGAVPATGLQALSDDLAQLVERTVPAVVGIRVSLPRAWVEEKLPTEHPKLGEDWVPMSEGSGFLINEGGHVLTCDHVVTPFPTSTGEPQPERRIALELHDGRRLAASLVGRDDLGDLALLKIEGESKLPYLPLGSAKTARVGEIVLAIGNPFGVLSNSVSLGILSGSGRSLLQGDLFGGLLQTDATVNVGNSGGPLLDARGAVIGIANAKGGATGVGFAIPIDEAKRVLPELKADGSPARGYLGIRFATSTENGRQTVVGEVLKDSPAQKAGVREGDVLMKVFDTEVDSITAVTNRIGALRPGDTVRVQLRRGDETLEREIVLGRRSSK